MPLAILGMLLGANYSKAKAQAIIPILQKLEPGIRYSQFKQWAIENKLVFESFTKDSMVVRDTGTEQLESIRIQSGSAAVTTTVGVPQISPFSRIFRQRSTL